MYKEGWGSRDADGGYQSGLFPKEESFERNKDHRSVKGDSPLSINLKVSYFSPPAPRTRSIKEYRGWEEDHVGIRKAV